MDKVYILEIEWYVHGEAAHEIQVFKNKEDARKILLLNLKEDALNNTMLEDLMFLDDSKSAEIRLKSKDINFNNPGIYSDFIALFYDELYESEWITYDISEYVIN